MLVVMKLVILYRPDSEHERDIQEYIRQFQKHYDAARKVEMVSLNTRDGAASASLYDIVSYPAILALTDDGRMLNIWQGMPLPLMDDIAGYAQSSGASIQ